MIFVKLFTRPQFGGARILRRKRVNRDFSQFATKARKCVKMANFATKECRCIKMTFTAVCVKVQHKIYARFEYDQLTNYLEKLGYFSNPPQKSCSNFFWVAQDLILVQLILIMQKITKKSLFGHFLGYPPKMHYSALQCSAMYWSANAWIIHSRWVK